MLCYELFLDNHTACMCCICFPEIFFFRGRDKRGQKSIGRFLVQHTTVGLYTETEDMRAEEDRHLRLFKADRASACGVRLSPLPTLHSLAQDIDTQISAGHYLDLLALGAAADALRLGLVVMCSPRTTSTNMPYTSTIW